MISSPAETFPKCLQYRKWQDKKEDQASNKEILRKAYRKQEPGVKRGILSVTIGPMVEILVKQGTNSRLDVTKSAE